MRPTKRYTTVTEFPVTKRTRRPAGERAQAQSTARGEPDDRDRLLRFLNEALATELVCVLRYRRHHFMARAASARIAEEFLIHADEKLAHADQIAERIVQLQGEPDFAPDTLGARSHARYVAATTVAEMISENLAAERIAITTLRTLIEYLGEADPITRRMLEGILGVEEAHAEELLDLLQGYSSAD